MLAAVRDVKESHRNLGVILGLLKVNDIECSVAMDLKCMNLTLGMQSASARHPCPFGLCYKAGKGQGPVWLPGDWVTGELRTLESLKEHMEQWVRQSGGNRAKLKDYYNVEFQPLFTTYRPNWEGPLLPTYILTKIPPPPLHTFRLGPVNHLLEALGKLYPELEQHLAHLHVLKDDYHGKTIEGEIF